MITLELQKLRRLKLSILVGGMLLALCLFNLMPLFSSKSTTTIDLAGELMGIETAQALFVPILIAIITTRLVEIEHSGNGWQVFSLAGAAPGTLCRVKFAVLALIITVFTALEILIPLGVCAVVGADNMNVAAWVSYGGCVLIMNLLCCMFHIVVAQRFENQLVSIGVGALGAFIAMFCYLLPPVVVRFIPWGYYAIVSTVTTSPEAHGAIYINPGWNYVWFVGFAVLVTAWFYRHTITLNAGEK
ncbi:MAG: ABC transporter permease [Corynebacterium sp.]|nr:ABC transporter permease [Corynebacterium sp.]